MAKLHSKKKGKSGSHKPGKKEKPEWLEYSRDEVEEFIRSLAKEGHSATTIGRMLRDEYGVPMAAYVIGMPIGKFLEKEKLSPKFPDDLLSLIKKAVRMRQHLRENKTDVGNKVKLQHVESKIQRLTKYYVKKDRVPAGWKYDPETAALLVK